MENGEEMISASDFTVVLPCIYPNTDPLWMIRTTCKRFGIEPVYFGLGDTYAGWVDIMLKRLMEAAEACQTSHLFYSDARDAFFLTGLEEITEKYNAMGCPPCMLAADCQGFSAYQRYYDKVQWDVTKHFPYYQTGGKIGEAKYIADCIRWMFERSKSGDWGEMPGDDAAWWPCFMEERPDELVIDHNCEIYQNCTTTHLEVEDGRVRNTLTNSLPCVLHFNGGYTDQVKGKWERMEPMWRKLGYTENPPWEAR
jgi:hypothetical protein